MPERHRQRVAEQHRQREQQLSEVEAALERAAALIREGRRELERSRRLMKDPPQDGGNV